MHYAFIKKCSMSDGVVKHYAHVVEATRRDGAKQRVLDDFKLNNIHADPKGAPLAKLEELLDAGECDLAEGSMELYDKTTTKAAKLDEKAKVL
jgi:hypothetical protein